MEHKLKFGVIIIMASLFVILVGAMAYGAYCAEIKPIIESGGWPMWLLIAVLPFCAWLMVHAWRKGVRHV